MLTAWATHLLIRQRLLFEPCETSVGPYENLGLANLPQP